MKIVFVVISTCLLIGCSDPVAEERMRKEKQSEQRWEKQKKTLMETEPVTSSPHYPEIKL